MKVFKTCENYRYQSSSTKYNSNQLYSTNTSIPFCALNRVNNVDSVTFTRKIPNAGTIGNYIKNIGLIISEPKVFNNATNKFEECYIIYQHSERDGVFRLIKKDPLKIKELSNHLKSNPQIMNILETHNFYTADEILNKIEPINPKVANLFRNLRISEVGYTTITKARGKQIILDKGYKCKPNSDIIFIEDLIVKQKEYSKASRIVAFPMLKALQKNGDKDILTVALAIGENSASPVNLYLRMGFKPLKDSIQNIDAHKIHTYKGERLDPKYKVSMYLPEDAPLYKILERDSSLEEINSIKPNWFKRTKDES